MKKGDIESHHQLETELYRLRLLRDLKDPEYSPEREDAILEAMEAVWYRLSPEDRRVLEAERAAREAGEEFPATREPGTPGVDIVDVDEERRQRACLPPRLVVTAT